MVQTCGLQIWILSLPPLFYSLSTQQREEGLLQAESIAASSLLTTLHYHSPLTDTKQNPHSSFIGQIGSSTGWLTRICKRSFLLSNPDYTICLGRGEWQGSALQSFPKSPNYWRHNCNYLLLGLPAQQQLSPSHGSQVNSLWWFKELGKQTRLSN